MQKRVFGLDLQAIDSRAFWGAPLQFTGNLEATSEFINAIFLRQSPANTLGLAFTDVNGLSQGGLFRLLPQLREQLVASNGLISVPLAGPLFAVISYCDITTGNCLTAFGYSPSHIGFTRTSPNMMGFIGVDEVQPRLLVPTVLGSLHKLFQLTGYLELLDVYEHYRVSGKAEELFRVLG